MKIYLAAPLFNERERKYNSYLKQLLNHDVFLPQEDGELITNLLREGMDLRTAIARIHQNDLKALHQCELMIAVLDGAHVDSGVAFEIGFFSALGKPIIGMHNDTRSELPFGHNPMIAGALEKVVTNDQELLAAVKAFSDA